MAPARLDGVAAERRDAPASVDEDGQPALACEIEDGLERGVIERELLRAWVQLDPARAARERSFSLRERVVLGIEAAEREQATVAARRLLDHHVVRRRVSIRLVHREHEG